MFGLTTVYTAELCTDWIRDPQSGGDFMCSSGDVFGAGISIDVERVEGRFVPR